MISLRLGGRPVSGSMINLAPSGCFLIISRTSLETLASVRGARLSLVKLFPCPTVAYMFLEVKDNISR